MIYIIELIKGLFLSIGLILGFLGFAFLLVSLSNKKAKYKPSDLIEPFEKYKKQIIYEEIYEEVKTINSILYHLHNNVLPEELNHYDIKKNLSFQTSDKNGSATIKPIYNFEISKKKLKNSKQNKQS